jgi:hypothetical protein
MDTDNVLVRKDTPVPCNPFGKTKYESEKLLEEFLREIYRPYASVITVDLRIFEMVDNNLLISSNRYLAMEMERTEFIIYQ